MANNILMHHKNGDDWEVDYPITTIGNVNGARKRVVLYHAPDRPTEALNELSVSASGLYKEIMILYVVDIEGEQPCKTETFISPFIGSSLGSDFDVQMELSAMNVYNERDVVSTWVRLFNYSYDTETNLTTLTFRDEIFTEEGLMRLYPGMLPWVIIGFSDVKA